MQNRGDRKAAINWPSRAVGRDTSSRAALLQVNPQVSSGSLAQSCHATGSILRGLKPGEMSLMSLKATLCAVGILGGDGKLHLVD